jgi:hypothetical protein
MLWRNPAFGIWILVRHIIGASKLSPRLDDQCLWNHTPQPKNEFEAANSSSPSYIEPQSRDNTMYLEYDFHEWIT